VGDKLSAERDRDRAGGKSASGNGFFQDGECAAEAFLLRGKIAREERKSGFSIGQRQVQGRYVD
jgi:hypothetical protein